MIPKMIHNMARNGIALIEHGQVVAHIVYEGGCDHAIGAMPGLWGEHYQAGNRRIGDGLAEACKQDEQGA
jgi:hypothetical protein